MPDVDELLDLLDEQALAEKFGLAHDRARESFDLHDLVVDSRDAFLREIGRYYNHHYSVAILDGRLDKPFDDEMASGLAADMLRHAFPGNRTGEAAFSIARSGIDGGMRAVIDALAGKLREEQEAKYIEQTLESYIDFFSYEQREQLMQQYLKRYGHVLPPDERPSLALLMMNYREVIKIHVAYLNAVRRRYRR